MPIMLFVPKLRAIVLSRLFQAGDKVEGCLDFAARSGAENKAWG